MASRLILLMAIGLGSMYMLHLLAMDFMKIRRVLLAASTMAGPAMAVGRLLLRGKRSTNSTRYYSLTDATNRLDKQMNSTNFNASMMIFNWDRILNNDPLNCLPSLICQIVSGSEINNTEAKEIREFVDYSNRVSWSPISISNAYQLGFKYTNSSDKCYPEYPFCIYSAKTMLKILKWFLDHGS